MTYNPLSLEYAQSLDASDALADFRSAFAAPDARLIYLDGNSLGRLPLATQTRLEQAIRTEWGERLIRSWNEGWLEAPRRIAAKLAGIIGAPPEEVILADATSINLFKLAVAALRANPGRTTILTDEFNFPSDHYILQGVIDLLGGQHRLKVLRSPDGIHLPAEHVIAAIDGDTALVTFSHVAFKSAYLHELAAINAAAQAAGALTLWDLSHSAGAVPVDLQGSGADMAIGCTYKYLNGGPGAPAYLFVRQELQSRLRSPVWGWFGDAAPFEFELAYRPAEDMRRFQVGTPPVLSLLAIEPGIDLLAQAGMPAIRTKSIALTKYLIELADARLAESGFSIATPRNPARRGSHVALRHAEGYRINRALIEPLDPHEITVIPDFRAPDVIRLGIAPLYTGFVDVWQAVERLVRLTTAGEYTRFEKNRLAVT